VLGLDRILAIDLNAAGTQALVGGSSGLAALVDPDTLAVQLRLEGHTGPVNAVALAPDGSLAATGGEDGSVRIWELPSGRQLRVLVGHDGPLQALAFSGDGAGGLRLLSGSAVRNLSQTRNALLWEPRSGTLLRELNGHTNSVVAVDLSADGSRAMTGSFDDTARLWNTSDGTTLRTFGGNGGDVNAVAITADGSQAITGSGTTIRSYNLAGSGLRIINNAHGFAVRALAYTGDGTRFISGGTGGAGNRSGEVKVWSATGELQLTLEGHTQPVRTVLARGANQAISAGEDGVIRRWDSRLPQLRTLNHPPAVNTAAVSPDGTMLLTGGTDLVARLWDVASGNELRSFDGHTAAVSSVGFAPDSAYGISGGSLDRTAIIWNLATGDPATVIGHPVNAFVNTVNFFPNSVQDSPDQYRILTGAADGNLRIWSWNVLSTTATLERTIRQPGNPAPAVTAAAISKYGRWIASAGNGVISLWDRDGNLIRSFSGHSPQAISSLAFTDDELHLVSGASDYTARIWTLENGASRIFRTGLNTDQFVRSVAISSDGSRLLVGNGNQGYLIDVASGEPLLTLRGHTGPVQAVAFVGTSELLTASADGAIRLTTTGGAALSVVPGGHTDRVTSLDYNADGSRLLSASWDGSLRIWDMVNRTLERTLRGHSGFAHVAQWSADGRFILSGTLNREIFLWDVASGAIVQQFGTATGGATPYGLALSPDGSLVAAGRDNSILIYDATTGALARTLHVHSGVVNSLAFLPNGNLVSGSGDGSALVVDPSQEGVILASLGGSNGPVEAVAVSNDGSRIALGDRDGASIWQADGQLVRRFPSGEGSAKVVQVAFAPDGSQLLAARSNAAELWDVGSGALLRAFEQHLPEVASVAYHPNGLQVASGGARGDNSVRLWEVKVSAPQGGDLLGHEQGIQAIAFSSDGQEVLTGSSYSKWVERDCCPPPS
jgi:WD40 repeat protein